MKGHTMKIERKEIIKTYLKGKVRIMKFSENLAKFR